MKPVFLFCTALILHSIGLYAQKDLEAIAAGITSEGKALYRTDMASWHGTDVMKAQFKGDMDSIGGYFSYAEEQQAHCVFYSRYHARTVVFEVIFDSTYQVGKASYTHDVRPFTPKELELYEMRNIAANMLRTDTIFTFYKNTAPNIIPLVYKGERKAYIITGTTLQNRVPLGNDYALLFDKDLNVAKTSKIHRNLILVETPDEDTGLSTVHSHLPATGAYITPTDICTIMEYERLVKWKTHYVISDDYVSIWDCQKDRLVILTREAWDAITKRSSGKQ